MTEPNSWNAWWSLLSNLQWANKWANIFGIAATIGIAISYPLSWWTGVKIADRMQSQINATQQRLVDRTLTETQQSSIASKLTAFKGLRADVGVFPLNNETGALGLQIVQTLKTAGLNSSINQAMADGPLSALVRGVLVRTSDDARGQAAASALVDALRAENIAAFQDRGLPPSYNMIFIVVGEKP